MPKKKGKQKGASQDFTINDFANAPKPVTRPKKSVELPTEELSWDQIDDNDLDIVEEISADGTKNFVYRKKRHYSKTELDINDRPGLVHPEVVWYLISRFIDPEDVGRFAGINKATYACTKTEAFWRNLYRKHCNNHPNLPQRLRLENSYQIYGLCQRVIRALYHTYHVFIDRVKDVAANQSRPHDLIKRQCISLWYCKIDCLWLVYFKFKKLSLTRNGERNFSNDLIAELGRIDANPDENCQVLKVACQGVYEVPPLMGMVLSSVSIGLSKNIRHRKLQLGFNTGVHNISKNILPENTVILDRVLDICVYDWWHKEYPHFDNKVPAHMRDEEALPVLKKDFF